MLIHRLNLNGTNYDLPQSGSMPHPTEDRMRQGMRTTDPFRIDITTRQGRHATLMVNPAAVSSWVVYDWDTEVGVTSGSPDWAADLAAAV